PDDARRPASGRSCEPRSRRDAEAGRGAAPLLRIARAQNEAAPSARTWSALVAGRVAGHAGSSRNRSARERTCARLLITEIFFSHLTSCGIAIAPGLGDSRFCSSL